MPPRTIRVNDLPKDALLTLFSFQSQSRCSSVPDVPIKGEWVTFIIKKTTLGRNGWKIMTENENMNLRMNREIIDMVTERIR